MKVQAAHHGREGMAVETQGGWSHCVIAGKWGEKNDGAHQDFLPLLC